MVRERVAGMVKVAAKLMIPSCTILVAMAVSLFVPSSNPANYESLTYLGFLRTCLILYCVFALVSVPFGRVRSGLAKYSWFIGSAFLLMALYDILTVKAGILKLPFFPAIDKVCVFFTTNYDELLQAALFSMQVLLEGIVWGVIAAVVSGTLAGCSAHADYWIAPLLRIIGPIPSLIWLPIAFVAFPSTHAASIFIVAVAVWFPLTLKLSAAIKRLPRNILECARVQGASRLYLIVHVVVPLVLPAFFEGLFMSVALSFGSLTATEALGSLGGLSRTITFYGQIVKYQGVWAAFIVTVVCFALIMRLLFVFRDYFLRWQKGYKRWR